MLYPEMSNLGVMFKALFYCGVLISRLNMQVHADFEWISKAYQLSTLCLYGGSPYQPQESALRRGIDIVVGTPGRVKDHVQRNTLKLNELQ